jgi:hypothetical protein
MRFEDWKKTQDDRYLCARHVWEAAREAACAEIKAADDKASEGDYMLDSDDCISVIRGTWRGDN